MGNKLRGGFRPGAGRPKKIFATKVIRIPEPLESSVRHAIQSFEMGVLKADVTSYVPLPLYESRVQAGFPSVADDRIEQTLDLNCHLIQHEAATFFVRAIGDSMVGAGIFAGDLLIVDKSLAPTPGKIIVALLDGGFTVKRLKIQNKAIVLCSENSIFPDIHVKEEDAFEIYGVVTNVIHSLS